MIEERPAGTEVLNSSASAHNSGTNWVEKIPSHWSVEPLKFHLLEIEQGWSTQSDSFPANADEWGVLKVGAVNGWQFNPDENKRLPCDLQPLTEYEIQCGDLLISRANTPELVGSAALVKHVRPRLLLCDKLYRLKINCRTIDPEYLVYFLRSSIARYEFESDATGVSSYMQNISQEAVKNLFIPVPPLSEQRSIAQYLDHQTAKIDTLITAKQHLLELLAEKRRTLITHTVTRGLNPDTPVHHSGIDLLGDMPVDWDLLPLRRLLRLMDYGISESVDVQGKIAVLRMGDVSDGEISYKNVGFVEEVDPRLLLATNDLVFNRTNSLDQVGKVGIFRGNASFPVSFASYLVRLRCNHLVIPEFLNYQLNSQPMLAWARSEALPAIGQANLNPNRYSYMPIPLPPVYEQIKIVEYLNRSLKKIHQLCTATKETIELLQEKRTSVISAVVLGKIQLLTVFGNENL